MSTPRRTPLPLICLLCLVLASLPLLSPPARAGKGAGPAAPTIGLVTARPGNIFSLTEPVTVTVTMALPAGAPRQFALAEWLQDFTGAKTSLITPTAVPAATGTTTAPITATATPAFTGTATLPLTVTATPALTATLPLSSTALPSATITPTTTLTATATPVVTATAAVPPTTMVTLAPGRPQQTMLTLPIHTLGYFELHVTLTDPSSSQTTEKTIALGVMAARQAGGADPASPFGVIGGLTQSYGNRANDLVRAAKAMSAAGIGYTREEFNWQTTEPKPGRGYFNFRREDIAIVAAHKAGLRVLGLIDYWGHLPQPDTTYTYSGTQKLLTIVGCSKGHACAYTQHGVDWFARFAAAVVKQYKPGGVLARAQGWGDGYGITEWEIWNEPSTLTFWRHDLGDYATIFAAMYRATATAIHAADPRARVMYDESGQNIDTSLAAGHIPHDVLALHIYTGGLDPDTALVAPVLPRGGLGQAPAAISPFLSGRTPVWVTETGYPTDGSVTPRQQADYLVRLYTNYLAAGSGKVFWFKFHEDAPVGDNLYSLVHGDFSPKPAYLAYATMTHRLAGASFSRTVSLGAQVHATLFAAGSATTAVLWSSGNPASLAFTLGGTATATAYDLMDNPIAQQASGAMTLPLTADPLFLVVQGQTPAQLAAALQAGQVGGIQAAGLELRFAPGLINNLPDIKAIVSAQTNVPISGTVSLALPDGWSLDHPARSFTTLQPGQSTTLSFHLLSEVDHPGDTIVATATTTLGQTTITRVPASTFIATYGHPPIAGSLSGWSGAAESDLTDLTPGQVIGIPGWSPETLSARIYTMWDEHRFYLAADVHSALLAASLAGYEGDWFQFGWGMDPAAWNSDQGPNRFNVTTALIKPDPVTHRPGVWSQWASMRQAVRPDPATGDLIYTMAVPWDNLGGFAPGAGKQFAFNLLINLYQGGSRAGWIQFTPGIRLGFFPNLYPLWTLIQSNPSAGLRLGGQFAPLQGALSLRAAEAQGRLVIHDGGMSSISLTINGRTISLATGAGPDALQPFVDTSLDLSHYLHVGTNTISASGTPARAGGAAVISFFQ